MFEKEAEIYALSNFGFRGKNSQRVLTAKIDYQYGAEFGYNKAKEEMQEQGLALQSDMDKTIEQNIQLKKHNNWLEGCKLELAEHLGKANDKISELEQQIEKMKCCGNCEHFNFSEPNYCHKGVYRERQYVCSEWKFGN